MNIANQELGIPIIVRPEDFSSPHLDELSGMTYLSYYMMIDSPGYLATRREIRAILQQGTIDNFQTDWNDGHLLCNLVKSVGGDVPGWPHLTQDHVTNLQTGIDAAKRLGIDPIFSAKEMADPEVEHLGIMAYAAHFRHLKPVKIVKNKATMDANLNNVYVKQERHFVINAENGTSHESIRPEVIGPDSIVPVKTKWNGNRCDCYFTPTETGQHKLNVYCDNENIPGCPVTFKVNADRSKVKFNQVDKAIVGHNSELKVDTSAAGQGDVRIEATSPSGHVMNLPVMYKGGVHAANFTPNEIGDWLITMIYDGEHINGSPYTIKVFDPSLVHISNLHGGTVGHQLAFYADSRDAGEGDVSCQVFYGGSKVPCHMKKDDYGKYTIDFTPQGPGTYTVHAYMNDVEVKGSPYTVDIIDTSRVTVTGEGLSLVPVNTPAVFTIHTNGAGGGKVDVNITAPSGKKVSHKLRKINEQTYQVDYTLEEPEETHLSNYASIRSKSHSFSKAFKNSSLSIKGDYGLQGDHSGGDEEKYVFNFPGPGDLPMSPTMADGQLDTKDFKLLNDQISHIYGENTGAVSEIPYFVTYNKDGSVRSTSHKSNNSFNQSNSSKISETNNIILSSSSSSSVDPKTWTLSRADLTDASTFIPQRSSTLVNKHSHKSHSVSNTPTTGMALSTLQSSVPLIKVSRTDSTNDRIVYEKIPDTDTGLEQRKYSKVTQEDQNSNLPNKEYKQHLSSFDVRNSKSKIIDYIQTSKPKYFFSDPPIMNKTNNNAKGEYTIEVKFAEQEISGSPFTTKAFDMRKLVVSGMPSTATKDSPVRFHIDASQAGAGNIEIRVNEGRVPCTVENKGNHYFTASFLPENSRPHSVEISFNDTQVVGSPWTILIVDPKSITLRGKEKLQCNKKASTYIQANGQNLIHDELDIIVKGPKGDTVPYDLSAESTGDKVIEYIPTLAGEYTILVKYCDHHVSGSPFTAKAYNIGAIYVSPLQDGFVNQPMYFKIDVGEAGEGQLQIMVNNGNTPNDVDAEGTGNYKIKFVPTFPGKQVVDILFNDKPLPCSPLTCIAQELSASITDLHQIIPVHQSSSFHLQFPANISNLTSEVIITAPTGENIPARLLQQSDGDYKVEWTPNKPGRHSVDVMYGGQQIHGSPFYIDVFDIHKIRVNNFFHGNVNEKAGFKLDCTQAGKSEHEIRVLSPSGRSVPYNIDEHNPLEYSVWYTPVESGPHKIFISYGGMELNERWERRKMSIEWTGCGGVYRLSQQTVQGDGELTDGETGNKEIKSN
ncbi:hypothetical protein Btru_048614 [Bulinus truncatus]|nr:hypothetical protein Btru_048614 [Bulinus truncatus]